MDSKVVVHLHPDEVLVEGGTEGLLHCQRCERTTEHYVTGAGDDERFWTEDDGSPTFWWRCTNCEDLVNLFEGQTLLAVYAKWALEQGLIVISEEVKS